MTPIESFRDHAARLYTSTLLTLGAARYKLRLAREQRQAATDDRDRAIWDNLIAIQKRFVQFLAIEFSDIGGMLPIGQSVVEALGRADLVVDPEGFHVDVWELTSFDQVPPSSVADRALVPAATNPMLELEARDRQILFHRSALSDMYRMTGAAEWVDAQVSGYRNGLGAEWAEALDTYDLCVAMARDYFHQGRSCFFGDATALSEQQLGRDLTRAERRLMRLAFVRLKPDHYVAAGGVYVCDVASLPAEWRAHVEQPMRWES